MAFHTAQKTIEAGKCAESVYHQDSHWGHSYQCQRKAGHGPDRKYCRQHAEKFAQGETSTWYRADCYSEWSLAITPVEVLKETPTSLLIKGAQKAERQAKISTYYRYFPTHEEAVELYQKRITALRARAEKLQQSLDAIKK